ncbi:hypothetical protein [Crossiella sp. NPDC003009]
MEETPVPVADMTISVRSRRDVVIVDPERFLAAARQGCRDLYPEATEAEADAQVAGVRDAVFLLLDRDGQLAPWDRSAGPEHGPRPDGLAAAGFNQAIVLNEGHGFAVTQKRGRGRRVTATAMSSIACWMRVA